MAHRAGRGSKASRPYRVLTEDKHQLLRHDVHNLTGVRSSVAVDRVMVTDGARFPAGAAGANLNLAYASHSPLDAFPPSCTGHHGVIGNAFAPRSVPSGFRCERRPTWTELRVLFPNALSVCFLPPADGPVLNKL